MKSGNRIETVQEKLGDGVLGFVSPLPQREWGEFRKYYVHAFVWILLLTAVAYKLESSGILEGVDLATLDNRLHIRTNKASNNVAIIEVGDRDYEEMFHGRSPLCRDSLLKLVANVRSYNPAAIGVDIDTSVPVDPKQSCGDGDLRTLTQLTTGRRSPVIWGRALTGLEAPTKPWPSQSRTAGPVTSGAKLPVASTPNDSVGISTFPVDSDGLVRRYAAQFPAASPASGESSATDAPLPSLARSLLDRSKICESPDAPRASGHYAGVVCPIPEAPKEPVAFNFNGDRYRFPTLSAHEFASPDAGPKDAGNNLLTGKIVLIAATFQGSRDFYWTPVGRVSQVELTALAVQSDLSGGGIRNGSRFAEGFANLLLGSLIVIIFFAWAGRPVHAFLISVIAAAAAAVCCSALLYHTSSFVFDFVPVALGTILQQALALAHRGAHLGDELRTKTSEVQQLMREKQILNDKLVLTNHLWESRERDRERTGKRDFEVKTKAQGAGGRS